MNTGLRSKVLSSREERTKGEELATKPSPTEFLFLDIFPRIFRVWKFKNLALFPMRKFKEETVENIGCFKFRERGCEYPNGKVAFPYLADEERQSPRTFGDDDHGFQGKSRQALVIGREFRCKYLDAFRQAVVLDRIRPALR